jgi:hypothetical protein
MKKMNGSWGWIRLIRFLLYSMPGRVFLPWRWFDVFRPFFGPTFHLPGRGIPPGGQSLA